MPVRSYLVTRVQEPNLRAILQALYLLAPDSGEIEVAALLERLPDEQQRDLVARLVLEPLGDEGVQQQIDDCLTAIQRRDIEAQLKGLKEGMHEAERQGDMVRLAHLQRQFAELRRTLITRASPAAQRPETSSPQEVIHRFKQRRWQHNGRTCGWRCEQLWQSEGKART